MSIGSPKGRARRTCPRGKEKSAKRRGVYQRTEMFAGEGEWGFKRGEREKREAATNFKRKIHRGTHSRRKILRGTAGEEFAVEKAIQPMGSDCNREGDSSEGNDRRAKIFRSHFYAFYRRVGENMQKKVRNKA